MPNAIIAPAYGGPEVLTLVDVPREPPGPGDVVVEVRAIGTNPVDFKVFGGMFGTDPASLPMRVGNEASGVIVEVGSEGLTGPSGAIAVGDEVVLYRVPGAYATELTVPASTVVAKPAGLSFEQAAGLMLTGATAMHALTATRVGAGDTVVVHGASGGVGLTAVQVAIAWGARVLGTAGARNHDRLRELGAEPVAYGDGLLERLRALAPDGVDAAIDTVGTDEALDTSLELVADRDRIATIAGFARGAEAGIQLLGGGPGADPGTELRNAARLELVELAAQGSLEVFVAKTYPLAEAAAALHELGEGHPGGKIVLVP